MTTVTHLATVIGTLREHTAILHEHSATLREHTARLTEIHAGVQAIIGLLKSADKNDEADEGRGGTSLS